MEKLKYLVWGYAILSGAALFWAVTKVDAQTQTATRSEITQTAGSLQNSTAGYDIETKGRLRSITNADRAAAAKRAAEARTAVIQPTGISNTTATNTTATETNSADTTVAAPTASGTLEGGSK